jgi:hypothetical protein
MSNAPTRAQLENGARGISYRAWQLAGVASLICREVRIGVSSERDAVTITNALVESGLVNARAVAYFFTRPSDVHISNFGPGWADDVIGMARKVEAPVSRHLSHATTGEKGGEVHPGAWPIVELAVVLIDGLVRFVEDLGPASPDYDVAWFQPSPVQTYSELMALDPLANPTQVSNSPSVGNLTVELQQYRKDHGVLP